MSTDLAIDHPYVQIAGLMRDVQTRSSSVQTALDDITAAALRFVPAAQYAGITITTRGDGICTPSATGPVPRLLDQIQGRYRQGPCLQAIHEQRTVRVDDLSLDSRWPDYQRDALSQTSIRSVLSVSMSADQHTPRGALNFYAEGPDAFDSTAEDLGFVYATHTALTWMSLRRDDQFRRALASRDLIGQAKGILMERHHIDADEAFARLRTLSQNSNVAVIEISRQLIKKHTA